MFLKLTQLFERMSRMRSAPQGALMANAALACPAINAQLFVMHRTLVQFAVTTSTTTSSRCTVVRLYVGADLLQTFDLHGDLLEPATVDQFVDAKRCTTVGTLPALFGQPTRNAFVAAELRAVRTQMGVLQLLHAYEAAKYIVE